jgi:hypothetical protein
MLMPPKATIEIRSVLLLAFALSLALASHAHAQVDDSEQPPLSDYEGSFEGRDFQIESNTLTYFREGMQNSIGLEVIGDDHFAIVIPPGAVVQTRDDHPIPTFRFTRDEDGNVISLSILTPDGELMSEHPRTGDVKPIDGASPAN